MWSICSRISWPSVSSLEKRLFRSRVHFHFDCSLLSCRSSSYILGVNPLLNIWFVSIFSHLVDCFLFIYFFDGFLCCAELLSLISPICLFLLLLPLPLESGPRKHCQEWCQWAYCLLPSRSCMISGHIFKAFWVNFCVWYKTTAIFGKAHL